MVLEGKVLVLGCCHLRYRTNSTFIEVWTLQTTRSIFHAGIVLCCHSQSVPQPLFIRYTRFTLARKRYSQ
nr:hypothetical protein Q903MT_gene80 [Picea sitchensis]